jgi:hypothetical protein
VHDRVSGGTTEAMAEAAFAAWRADAKAGRATVLISDSNEAVASLNARAHTELILEGRVKAVRDVALHDGNHAAVGDTVITRRNDRQLRSYRSWVRNGDRWTVIGVGRNGSVEVRPVGRRRGSTVILPAHYVRQHLELGYAVTSHRAQGITTDTAHVVVTTGMTRENLYVAMTRGRASNRAYVAVDRPDVAHVGARSGDDTARSILCGVLKHVGAELSAHETIVAQQDAWKSVAQLAAEYETIAAAAQLGLSAGQADDAIASVAFGPLTAELRRAEAHGLDTKSLLTRAVATRGFDEAQDVAAVLRDRVVSAIARDSGAGRSRRKLRLVAGLIPRAVGPMDPDMSRALIERSALIEARASAVLNEALLAGAAWTRALGAAPRGSVVTVWRLHACTVAAYRDRYGIVGSRAIGHVSQSTAQKFDAARARAALEAARRLAESSYAYVAPRPALRVGIPPIGIRP